MKSCSADQSRGVDSGTGRGAEPLMSKQRQNGHFVNQILISEKWLTVPTIKGPDFAGRRRFCQYFNEITKNRAGKWAFCQPFLAIWENG